MARGSKHTTGSGVTKETRAKASDVVEIRYTGEAKYHKEGAKSTVHKVQAAKLVQKGVAEYADGSAGSDITGIAFDEEK